MSLSFNKFKSTTIYGNFQNSDLDQNNTSNANSIFDRNMLVNGTLQSNDASFNTIKINGNITSNSLIITPTQLSYLKDSTSNIQTQINSVKTQADGLSTLLQNTQYINGFGLNFYGSVNVFGTFYVTIGGTKLLDVKTLLNDLPTTYVSIDSLATTLSSYVTNTSLTSTLNSYASIKFTKSN